MSYTKRIMGTLADAFKGDTVSCSKCGKTGPYFNKTLAGYGYFQFSVMRDVRTRRPEVFCDVCRVDAYIATMRRDGRADMYYTRPVGGGACVPCFWTSEEPFRVLRRSTSRGRGFHGARFDIEHVWFTVPEDDFVWIGRHAGYNNTQLRARRTKTRVEDF